MMRALMTKTLFVLSILLSAQALAFDVGGLSYDVINATDVEVTGRASGNTATNIVIPATVVGSGTTYSVTTIGGQAFVRDYPPFNEQAIPALTSVIIPDSVTTIGDMLSPTSPHQRDYSRQRYDHWVCFRQQRPHQRDYSRQRYEHWEWLSSTTPSPA